MLGVGGRGFESLKIAQHTHTCQICHHYYANFPKFLHLKHRAVFVRVHQIFHPKKEVWGGVIYFVMLYIRTWLIFSFQVHSQPKPYRNDTKFGACTCFLFFLSHLTCIIGWKRQTAVENYADPLHVVMVEEKANLSRLHSILP